MTDYGSDLSCVEDVTEDGRTVSGRRLHAEAIARRWTTDRGTLIEDPHYGENLENYLADDLGPNDLAAIAAAASAEAMKDARTVACDVIATSDADGTLTIAGTLTDADGPFPLVVAVSAVTFDLLEAGA